MSNKWKVSYVKVARSHRWFKQMAGAKATIWAEPGDCYSLHFERPAVRKSVQLFSNLDDAMGVAEDRLRSFADVIAHKESKHG